MQEGTTPPKCKPLLLHCFQGKKEKHVCIGIYFTLHSFSIETSIQYVQVLYYNFQVQAFLIKTNEMEPPFLAIHSPSPPEPKAKRSRKGIPHRAPFQWDLSELPAHWWNVKVEEFTLCRTLMVRELWLLCFVCMLYPVDIEFS